MSIPKNDISIAEPIDVQIDQLGNNITTVCQCIGVINDEKCLDQKAFLII